MTIDNPHSVALFSLLRSRSARAALSCLACSAAWGLTACSESEPSEPSGQGGGEGEGGHGGANEGGASSQGSLYVIATAVSDNNDSNTYIVTFDEFAETLDLSGAREFPGWSDMLAIGEDVFVSSAEAPTVTRLRVQPNGTLGGDKTLSFSRYVQDANFYNHALVSETKVYLVGEGEYVIWDPSTLKIMGTLPFPELPDREGILPYIALDRGAVVRENRLYHTVAWSDTQNLEFLPDSQIVVIDVEKDRVVDVITVPCPDVALADRDEAGNLYFSNWVYSPGGTLLNGAPNACAVRILAGSEELDDWQLSYDEITGREGAVLSYLGKGKWVFSSFMNDPDDPSAQEDWFTWLFGNHWEATTLDPNPLDVAPLEGLPWNGGGYYLVRFDGVTRFLLPTEDYNKTTVYAIGEDGKAIEETKTDGWATRLFKLR